MWPSTGSGPCGTTTTAEPPRQPCYYAVRSMVSSETLNVDRCLQSGGREPSGFVARVSRRPVERQLKTPPASESFFQGGAVHNMHNDFSRFHDASHYLITLCDKNMRSRIFFRY